jgi:hypothetical protein
MIICKDPAGFPFVPKMVVGPDPCVDGLALLKSVGFYL